MLDKLPRDMVSSFISAVSNGKSILISGETGVGKSTLTSQLAKLVPSSKKVTMVDRDTESIRTHVRIEEGLLVQSLKRPTDVVVLDELRGEDALVALDQMLEEVAIIANIYSSDVTTTLNKFVDTIQDYSDHPVNIWDMAEDVVKHVEYIIHIERHEAGSIISSVLYIDNDGTAQEEYKYVYRDGIING